LNALSNHVACRCMGWSSPSACSLVPLQRRFVRRCPLTPMLWHSSAATPSIAPTTSSSHVPLMLIMSARTASASFTPPAGPPRHASRPSPAPAVMSCRLPALGSSIHVDAATSLLYVHVWPFAQAGAFKFCKGHVLSVCRLSQLPSIGLQILN
jgi:hypothetical protein